MTDYKMLPEPGRAYRHFKGGLYEFLTMATHSETKEELVVYRSMHYGTVYARPLSEWFEKVPEGRETFQEHRFELV